MNLRADATYAYFFPMKVIEAPKPVVRGPQVWPLGVKAYHALGDLGLIPEKTELLYGQIFHKMPKSFPLSFTWAITCTLPRSRYTRRFFAIISAGT